MTRVCTFALAERHIAIDTDRIREVVPLRELTTIAGGPRHVCGLINLRGQIVACLDTAALLALTPSAGYRMAVLVDDGDGLVSLAVDAVGDVIELEAGSLTPVPATVAPEVAVNLTGTHQRPGHLVLVLDLPRLLSTGAGQ
jgi:purine-binding chemotaxis protein CheW